MLPGHFHRNALQKPNQLVGAVVPTPPTRLGQHAVVRSAQRQLVAALEVAIGGVTQRETAVWLGAYRSGAAHG